MKKVKKKTLFEQQYHFYFNISAPAEAVGESDCKTAKEDLFENSSSQRITSKTSLGKEPALTLEKQDHLVMIIGN